MRRSLAVAVLGLAVFAAAGSAQEASTGPYKVLRAVKAGGEGGFDYVYADPAGQRLYIPRSGPDGRITVFDLPSLTSAGEIAGVNAHGVAVDLASHHAFASSKPVAEWDTRTLKMIKTIDVEGGPDGILLDPFNHRVWVFSHRAPNATVIDAATGTVVDTVDLGGAPEQAVTDGAGHLYVDLENKDKIAVVDARTLRVTADYDLAGKGGGPGGLAFDVKHHVLFAACHNPATMVILDSDNGHVLATLPIGEGTDGATFNPVTDEAFSSNRDGTLTVIKESSPTSFSVEQNLKTMSWAKTLTFDVKSGTIYLIAADITITPPPAGQAARGRGGRGWFEMAPGSFTILEVGR